MSFLIRLVGRVVYGGFRLADAFLLLHPIEASASLIAFAQVLVLEHLALMNFELDRARERTDFRTIVLVHARCEGSCADGIFRPQSKSQR